MKTDRYRFKQAIIPFGEKWFVKTEANQYEHLLGMVYLGGENG